MEVDAVLFLYEKDNRYSVHALVAALDKEEVNIHIHLTNLKEMGKMASNYRNPLLAFSFTTPYLAENHNAMENVLRTIKGLKVAGGPHPTGDPLGTLRMGFDLVLVGDGESTLPALLEGDIPKGVVYREGDGFVFTGWNRVDINNFPSFPWWRNLFSPIEIERGCAHGCRYCETPFIHGKSRYRGIESVEEHISAMKERNKRHVRFIASDSFSYPFFFDLLEIQGVKLYVGSFPSEVRPDSVDEERLEAMKGRVANRRIIVGAQSGSERMLQLMNRGHGVEEVKHAVELILDNGFIPEVDFIFGLPGESPEDVRETMNVMEWIVKRGGRIHAHSFMPLPGTPWEDRRPGKVPDVVKRFVEHLTGKGLAYGYWKRQEKIGEVIHRFYREGKILGLRGWRALKYRLPRK